MNHGGRLDGHTLGAITYFGSRACHSARASWASSGDTRDDHSLQIGKSAQNQGSRAGTVPPATLAAPSSGLLDARAGVLRGARSGGSPPNCSERFGQHVACEQQGSANQSRIGCFRRPNRRGQTTARKNRQVNQHLARVARPGRVARPSFVFKWDVCRSLTEVALDDLDPDGLGRRLFGD